MERPVAADLSIARETSTTYHVMYRRRSEPRSAATPWCLHGRDTLRVFLQQCESVGNVARRNRPAHLRPALSWLAQARRFHKPRELHNLSVP